MQSLFLDSFFAESFCRVFFWIAFLQSLFAESFWIAFLQSLFAESFCRVFLDSLFAESFCRVFLDSLFLDPALSPRNGTMYSTALSRGVAAGSALSPFA